MAVNLDNILAVMSNVLYLIERLHINLDRAFTITCRKYRCHSPQLTREDLFNLVYEFVSKYIFIKSLAERGKRRTLSYRMCAKLFLYMKFKELGYSMPSKLVKAVQREFRGVDLDVVDELEPWQRLSYPQWIYAMVSEVLGVEEASKLLDAMNRRVYWLRINTLKVDIDRALRDLESSNVKYEVERSIPFLVKILYSPYPLRSLSIVKEGKAVIQDKASVLSVLALDPSPGELIYDFAAAPGIKTSLIMQLTDNKAHVVAFDRSPRRLRSMRALLKKYGVNTDNVQIALADSRIVSLSRKADRALVDAPCSSSGAISKDPSIKLMLKNRNIPLKMQQIQLSLLANALRYAEQTVYVTCSILPEEGEEVIENILSSSEGGVELVDVNIPASRGYSKYSVWNRVRRTYPHIDECEGFFIACIVSR